MLELATALAILDTIPHPIVFTDNDHIIRYLNKPAQKRYYELRGYSNLIGKSLFDCHSPVSREKILENYRRLQAGENEIYMGIGKYHEHVTVVAVRDESGKLIGYYERFEKVEQSQPVAGKEASPKGEAHGGY